MTSSPMRLRAVRSAAYVALAAATFVVAARGEDRLQPGRVVAFDRDAGTLTLSAGGAERALRIVEGTKFEFGAQAVLSRRTARLLLQKGVDVKFAASGDAATTLRLDAMPHADTSELTPLTELGAAAYCGKTGGLYPDGKNEMPEAHAKAGASAAAQVRPLGPDGRPAKDGKIVLLSVGMSNCTQEFTAFKSLADHDPQKDSDVVLVDGAQGGMTSYRICDPESADGRKYWATTDARLAAAKVAPSQVEVVWLKEADGWPDASFLDYAQGIQVETKAIVRHMKRLFPNLRIAFLSSRSYGGYASSVLNPEPYAYESGFSMKWLVEEQIRGAKDLAFDASAGAPQAPWLAWGPYLWANGEKPNADKLSYEAADFGADGTHPSSQGLKKIADRLLRFFKTDPAAKPWFLRK